MKNTKIRHVWSVLCTSSVVDSDSNNIILYVLESIQGNVKYNPQDEAYKKHGLVIPLRFEIVTLLQKVGASGSVEVDLKITVVGPDGGELGSFDQSVNIPKDKKRMRVRTRSQSLKINGVGDYWIKVAIKEKADKNFIPVAELPLEIKLKIEKTSAKSTSV